MKNIFSRLTSRKSTRKNETPPADPYQAAVETAYADRMAQVHNLFELCLEDISAPVPTVPA